MSEQNSEQNNIAEDELDSHRHITNHISSSLSGPGIGDLVAAKKANLIHAQSEPARGRRETPVHDPWPRRKLFIRGILLGLLVVVVAVIAIFAVLALQPPEASYLH